VNVIGHQAVGPDFQVRLGRAASKEAQVGRAVGGVQEDVGTSVAAVGDVVRQSGNNHARESGHNKLCITLNQPASAREKYPVTEIAPVIIINNLNAIIRPTREANALYRGLEHPVPEFSQPHPPLLQHPLLSFFPHAERYLQQNHLGLG